MFYQIQQYIKFLLSSTNQHGVHSPFVYDLVTKCFYDNNDYSEYSEINAYRKRLKHSHHKINVTDFGAGSKKLKSNAREVSRIAKHASISKNNAKLLFRLAKYFKPESVLELGTALGFATHALSAGHPKCNIITIEGCPEISAFTKQQLKLQNLENIDLKTGDFLKIIPELEPSAFDIIFFDGNHQKDTTLQYFESLLPKAHNNSIFIFDDIYWSKDMTEAWKIIKEHPKVTVTIDTFYWGIVFFRTEQTKEHFTIRT